MAPNEAETEGEHAQTDNRFGVSYHPERDDVEHYLPPDVVDELALDGETRVAFEPTVENGEIVLTLRVCEDETARSVTRKLTDNPMADYLLCRYPRKLAAHIGLTTLAQNTDVTATITVAGEDRFQVRYEPALTPWTPVSDSWEQIESPRRQNIIPMRGSDTDPGVGPETFRYDFPQSLIEAYNLQSAEEATLAYGIVDERPALIIDLSGDSLYPDMVRPPLQRFMKTNPKAIREAVETVGIDEFDWPQPLDKFDWLASSDGRVFARDPNGQLAQLDFGTGGDIHLTKPDDGVDVSSLEPTDQPAVSTLAPDATETYSTDAVAVYLPKVLVYAHGIATETDSPLVDVIAGPSWVALTGR